MRTWLDYNRNPKTRTDYFSFFYDDYSSSKAEEKVATMLADLSARLKVPADDLAGCSPIGMLKAVAKHYFDDLQAKLANGGAVVGDGGSVERRKKPVVFAEVMKTVKCSHGRHCSDCPKWRPSYCSITCAARLANSPVCKYGAKLLNNEECKRRYRERKSNNQTMKEYPEPCWHWLDIAETVVMAMVAIGLCVCVVFALYFALNAMGGVR